MLGNLKYRSESQISEFGDRDFDAERSSPVSLPQFLSRTIPRSLKETNMAYTTQTQLSIIDTGNTPLDVVEPTLETKDRYTFGVELEMAIAGLHPAHADPSPNDPRSVRGVLGTVRKDDFGANDGFEVLQHIAQTLTAAGIPAEAQPHARFAPNWKPQNISAWIVTHDASIQAPQIYTAVDPSSAYYHYHQIELISPVFFYSHSALTAVKTLCKTMSSSFRINVNPSCGLHIHVGKKSSGIPFETTRNLLATLFTYESQIESIHPRSRQKNPLRR
ncbi:hypothetical protein M7I_7292 [Glarea lozoyensis 74030]|uniref:Amidoligase enzyme n=1 Tax=Glarea lozoyensis (strain ATCC 74030 / MF5533) TaxID=1104152 RepID=H0EWW7_GLAL7|nr:hypothetical protein M7I_7292 [Glarea lozoyensis 74030]